jgi:O-antigen/teichoic acid export membrane protein
MNAPVASRGRWLATPQVGQFGRRVALLAGGTTLGRLAVILAAPLLTRLYSPDDFGLLAVYTALLGILGSIVCLRYEVAIPLPVSDRSAANLLVLCLLVALVMTLVIGLPVLLAPAWLAGLLGVPALAPYLWLVPVGLLGIGAYQTFSYWSIRKQDIRRLAGTRIVQGVGQGVVQIGWGLSIGGPLGLLLGGAFGQMAGSGGLAAAVWRGNRSVIAAIGPHGLGRALRRYRRFPLLATWSALLNAMTRQLPAILLAVLFGAGVAGLYALGQRIVRAPMQLIGSAVAQVYMGQAARQARQDPTSLRRLVGRVTVRMLLLGSLPIVAVALGGPWLFQLIFGPAWEDAGRYVQLLAPAFLAQFAIAPLLQTFAVLERQDLHLAWNVLQLAALGGVFWLSWSLALNPFSLLALVSASMVVSYVAVFGLLWWQLGRPAEAAVGPAA